MVPLSSPLSTSKSLVEDRTETVHALRKLARIVEAAILIERCELFDVLVAEAEPKNIKVLDKAVLLYALRNDRRPCLDPPSQQNLGRC